MKPLEIAHGVCGVYKITNLVNGKCYVGCSKDVRKRWVEHRTPKVRDGNLSLPRAFRKYGLEAFICEVLEECAPDKLDTLEIEWIARLKPEYNRTLGGRGKRGYIASQEERDLISRNSQAVWDSLTPEQRKARLKNGIGKSSRCKFGHPVSSEQRLRQSRAMKGRKRGPYPESWKKAISAGLRDKQRPGSWKQIACMNDSGRVLWFYPSVEIAAKAVGVSSPVLTGVLKGRRKHAAGFRWAYANVDALGPTDRPFHQEAKPL